MKSVIITVDNRLRMPVDHLPGRAVERLCELHTHRNPQHFKLKKMGFKAWAEPPEIRSWHMSAPGEGRTGPGTELSLPRGGMGRLRQVLSECGVGWTVIDRRTEGDPVLVGMREPLPAHKVALWDHQEVIVEGVLRRENCVVRSGTGSGKTTALLAAVARAQVPAIIVVWEKGLLRQWSERIDRELGLRGSDVGMIGGGAYRLRPITLAMQQSLNRLNDARWREVERAFGLVGADEISKFAAVTFRASIDRFPARYRIGMSADETRKDGKEFLIYDLFGVVGADVSQDELVEKGIVRDVEVRIVPSSFRADWYVEERERDGVVPDYDRLMDELQADGARLRLVTDLASRASADGRPVLVFCQRVMHCRRVDAALAAAGVRSGLMIGEDPAAYESTVRGLRDGSVRVGVGTISKIGLGLDLPSVSAGVVAVPAHNNRQLFNQIRGRLCRTAKGKDDAVLYYVWDRAVHGLQVLRNLRRWCKTAYVMQDDGYWIEAGEYIDKNKPVRRAAV